MSTYSFSQRLANRRAALRAASGQCVDRAETVQRAESYYVWLCAPMQGKPQSDMDTPGDAAAHVTDAAGA